MRQTCWGSGHGPLAIDQEVVYSDMTDWSRFGKAPGFFERKIEDIVITHPLRLGISGIGCGIASIADLSRP